MEDGREVYRVRLRMVEKYTWVRWRVVEKYTGLGGGR